METTDGGHGGDSAIDVISVAQGILNQLTNAMIYMSSDELTGLFPYFKDFYQSTTPGLLVIMDEQALDRFYSGMLAELADLGEDPARYSEALSHRIVRGGRVALVITDGRYQQGPCERGHGYVAVYFSGCDRNGDQRRVYLPVNGTELIVAPGDKVKWHPNIEPDDMDGYALLYMRQSSEAFTAALGYSGDQARQQVGDFRRELLRVIRGGRGDRD